jgi:hypothetical protein
MSYDMYGLGISDPSSPANPSDAMVGDGTVNTNERPVCTVSNQLTPQHRHTAVNFTVVDNGFLR